MAVSTILIFQNIKFTVIHTSDYFRKDNILFDICMYITLIGSLVILIKKRISRQIIQKIPKSNILPRPTNNQVRPNNEINTGDLFLLCQKYWHFLFCLKKFLLKVLSVICHSSSKSDYKRKQYYHKVARSRPVYYSIWNSFGQRSQYISIKFPHHKQYENP